MSKTSNMLNMVQILKDGKIHSIKDLSNKLEVSQRMIRVYKVELEQAGIYIESKKGILGGYYISNNLNNIDIGLTLNDIDLLNILNDYIITKTDFERKDDYINILLKIHNAYQKNVNSKNDIKLKILKQSKNNISKLYKDFKYAIDNKNKVNITYNSVNSGITKRTIHPAELFSYLDSWYVAAFCEKRNEIRLFKLSNILNYNILDEKYQKDFKVRK